MTDIFAFLFRGRSIHPFCAKVKRDPLQTECTDDRSSVALCNLIRHESPLPRQYQNFDSLAHVPTGEEAYYGGSVSLADHCPYIQEFTWRSRNVVVRGSQCQFEDNNPSELFGIRSSLNDFVIDVCVFFSRTREKLCVRIVRSRV